MPSIPANVTNNNDAIIVDNAAAEFAVDNRRRLQTLGAFNQYKHVCSLICIYYIVTSIWPFLSSYLLISRCTTRTSTDVLLFLYGVWKMFVCFLAGSILADMDYRYVTLKEMTAKFMGLFWLCGVCSMIFAEVIIDSAEVKNVDILKQCSGNVDLGGYVSIMSAFDIFFTFGTTLGSCNSE